MCSTRSLTCPACGSPGWWTWERTNFALIAEIMVEARDQFTVGARYDGDRATAAQARLYLDALLGVLRAVPG